MHFKIAKDGLWKTQSTLTCLGLEYFRGTNKTKRVTAPTFCSKWQSWQVCGDMFVKWKFLLQLTLYIVWREIRVCWGIYGVSQWHSVRHAFFLPYKLYFNFKFSIRFFNIAALWARGFFGDEAPWDVSFRIYCYFVKCVKNKTSGKFILKNNTLQAIRFSKYNFVSDGYALIFSPLCFDFYLSSPLQKAPPVPAQLFSYIAFDLEKISDYTSHRTKYDKENDTISN